MARKCAFCVAAALLLILAQSISAENACAFDPAYYSTLSNIPFNLSVDVTYGEGAKTIGVLCGSNWKRVSLVPQSSLYNLSCSYSTIGNKTATGAIFGDNYWVPLRYCTNEASIFVTFLSVGAIVTDSIIEMGTLANVTVNYTNFRGHDYSDVQINLTDVTTGTLIGSRFINLNDWESKLENFTWDTSNALPGSHALLALAQWETHYNSNSTTATLIKLDIADISNKTTNSSAKIYWNTSLLANSSISYWIAEGIYNTTSNATWDTTHVAQIDNLTNSTTYKFRITACSRSGRCNTTDMLSFKTAPNEQPAASPSPSASVTPSPVASAAPPTPSPSATASPGPTPLPTPTPTQQQGSSGGGGAATPIQTITPSPVPSLESHTIDSAPAQNEVDPWLLIGLENTTQEEIINSTDLSRFNNITVTKVDFDPEIVSAYSRVRIFATTDSAYPIKNVNCYIPTDQSKFNKAECKCELNYNNNFSRFKCEIVPKPPLSVLGTEYILEVGNDAGKKGIFTALLPVGQKASLIKKPITAKRNEFYFYAGIFVALMLVGYGMYHLLYKFEKESKAGEVLQQQKKKIIGDMDTLKFHYLKRDIDYELYNKAMMQKQKELTEVNTRLGERESRGSKKEKTPQKPPEGAQEPLEAKPEEQQVDMAKKTP
ncbi:MAG: fibronectin type III domain-containing protein [Candidatus Micrarchaeota archaeon]